jgi:hypothetical protein
MSSLRVRTVGSRKSPTANRNRGWDPPDRCRVSVPSRLSAYAIDTDIPVFLQGEPPRFAGSIGSGRAVTLSTP